jgi:tetratricopeptide (TPR) repeat protein
LAEQFGRAYAATRDRPPAELLLLAVRAARRALAVRPEDGGPWLLLGKAYLRLARQTREQGWPAALPFFGALRRAQAFTALETAVLLRPDLDEAHALLAQLHHEAGELDRALHHLRARLRISQQQARKRVLGAAKLQAELDHDVTTMERLVREKRQIYEGNIVDSTDPSKVADRAKLAVRYGLPGEALEMLLASHPAIFGKTGTQLQLDLMIQAGRAFEVRAWLEPEHEAVLGFSHFHWLRAQAAAACGDYAAADEELDRISEVVRSVRVSPTELVPVRTSVALRAASAVLTRPAPKAGPPGLASAVFLQFQALRPLGGPIDLLRQEADLLTLRGLLALEAGAVEDARRHLRDAVRVWGNAQQAAGGSGVDFAARPLAEEALRLLGSGPFEEGG